MLDIEVVCIKNRFAQVWVVGISQWIVALCLNILASCFQIVKESKGYLSFDQCLLARTC